MIVVDVHEQNNRVVHFTVEGHANFRKSGKDIVCAAISALVLNAINSCEQLLGAALEVHDDGDRLVCSVPRHRRKDDIELFMRSMVFGIEQTAESYPKYVKIRFHSK